MSGLFAFLATAIADSAEGRRPGARHAMLVYVTAADFDAAQRRAAGVAIGAGWMLVRLEKGSPLDAGAATGDPVLDAAAATALEEGSALVVYADELPADA
ncbi:hypothetical protein ACG3SL_16830 [Sphingomonas sp. CJ20]